MSDHEEIHMPPNSFVPISLALSLTFLFVSFLFPSSIRVPSMILGGVLVISVLVTWFRAARTEYYELPESSGE
jgi:Flp pilus assembly protein TadB